MAQLRDQRRGHFLNRMGMQHVLLAVYCEINVLGDSCKNATLRT